jgi:hypothetical protein
VKVTTNGGWPEQEGTLCNKGLDENCSNDVPVKPYTAPVYEVSGIMSGTICAHTSCSHVAVLQYNNSGAMRLVRQRLFA